jgi:hypothetical protein
MLSESGTTNLLKQQEDSIESRTNDLQFRICCADIEVYCGKYIGKREKLQTYIERN